MTLKRAFLPAFLFGATVSSFAQAPAAMAPIGVGNSMALQGGPETMDPTTLKFTFPVSVRHKAGVGLDFDATLTFNADPSSVTPPKTDMGEAVTNYSNVWTLGVAGGNAQPVLNANETINACGNDVHGNVLYEYTYATPIFLDKYGILREFLFEMADATECSQHTIYDAGQNGTNVSYATDGSGIKLEGAGDAYELTVNYPDGSVQAVTMAGFTPSEGTPPASLVLAQDANGNQITTNSAGNAIIDTLGQTVLMGVTIKDGAVQSWGTLSYQDSTGQTHSFITNGGQFEMPDGRSYKFAGETACPGTGRLGKVTLPAGGSISYSYGSCTSSGGMLTRIVNDNNGNTSTWTYTQGINAAGQSTLTVVDPASTKTVITYEKAQLQAGPDPYTAPRNVEIGRQTYDSSGNLLSTVATTYVGAQSNANAVILPIQSATTITSLPSTTGISAETYTTYNSVGQVGEVDTYDYGAAGGSIGPLLSKIVTTYTQTYYYGNADSTFPTGSTTYPGSVTTYDGSGTMLHKSILTYGNNALLTQTQQWVTGSTYLTTQYAYLSNGQLSLTTDPNGSISNIYYNQCDNSTYVGFGLPSGTTTVVKNAAGTQTTTLTTSETWDCVDGVPTSSTDVNGHTTTMVYNDPYLRMTNSVDWLGNATHYLYPTASSNTSEATMTFNAGGSIEDTLVTYDGLGRAILSQKRQSPSATTYDSVSTTYDSYGRAYGTSLPYSAAAGVVNTAVAKSTETYDALSRPSLLTDAAGGTTQYTYPSNLNDVLVTSGPAPVGESAKKKQMQYNALGQLTSVCEVTSGAQSGACSQSAAATGYFTSYTYDGDMLTKVSQNAQSGGGSTETRTMTYDGLGRKLSETLPETGTSTYVYDADAAGVCTGSFPGDEIKSTDNAGNVSCASYDSLHRMLTTSVASGPYASVTPSSNYVYDAATVNGVAMQNVAGTLAEAYTCVSPCTTKITDVGSSSAAETSGGSPTGRVVSTLYESTPHSNGYSQTVATVASNGALGALSGQGTGYTMPSMTYGLDGEGRPLTATDTTHATNLVTATAYNVAGGATLVTFGNGDKDTSGYDAYYRGNGFSFAIAASTPYTVSGALTLNANSTVKAMAITDTNDTTKNQSCSYSADDLNRLKTANCGSVWSQTFSYDPYGNISKSANGGTTYAATYGTQNRVVSGTPATYDANGNQTMSVSGSFGFNAAGQMVTATAGSSTSQATYDALGRMVETVAGSTTTQFVYSPLGTQYAVVQNGALLRGTVPLPGGDTAVYNSAGLSYIRHTDLLGSSRLATTWAHAVYSKDAYAPYGEPYDETATKDRSFTGQGSDITSNVGVFDFQFRKLETTAGRWLSPDPSGWNATDLSDPQSFNRYAYAENSPLMSVDPLGLDTYYIIVTNSCVNTGTPQVNGPFYGPDGAVYTTQLGQNCITTTTVYTVPSGWTPPINSPYQGYFISGYQGNASSLFPTSGPPRTVTHAPSNGMPKTPQQCALAAAKANAISFTADALGAVPGEGNVLAGFQLGAAGVGFVNSLFTKDAPGAAASIVGGQVTLVTVAAKQLGVPLAKAVPVLGNLFSAGLAVRDIVHGVQDYQSCLAGH